jgi:E3 ubiquitin-protein ligase BRE1
MAAKRPAVDDSIIPSAKKMTLPPLHVPSATGQEDLDIKILQIQNQKLSERLKERNYNQELLQQRLERLEEDKEAAIEVIVAVEHHLRVLVQELQAQLGTNIIILQSLFIQGD